MDKNRENRQKDIFSYHAFMFPFRFDRGDISESIKNRISIDEKFHKSLENKNWRYSKFKPINSDMYNEYLYFSEPVRETLYNFMDNFKEGEISYYYKREVLEGSSYTIKIAQSDSKAKEFKLKLTGISLRLFATGIGILIFEVENYDYISFLDILLINDYGRRVYPQFISDSDENYLKSVKGAFLADEIEIVVKSSKGEFRVKEDFEEAYREIPEPKGANDIKIGSHIIEILPEPFSKEVSIAPIIDDRMFVVSCARNNKLISKFQKDEELFLKDDKWYQYLFVDGRDKNIQYSKMQEELVKKSTYPRWVKYGTLWGITRYSFVSLTNKEGMDSFILKHSKYHYHQMAVLILAIYASLTRFSSEVSILSNLPKDDKLDVMERQVQSLYGYYIKFINKLYFRNLTPQEQGIELYNIAKSIFLFDEEVKRLDEEIFELHNYIDLMNEKRRNERLEIISKLGAIFLPPTLFVGIFGMNTIDFEQNSISLIISSILILLSPLTGLGFIHYGKKRIRDNIFFWCFLSILLVALFCMPTKGENGICAIVLIVAIATVLLLNIGKIFTQKSS